MTSKIEVPYLLAWRLAGLDPDYTAGQIDADEAELRELVEATEAPLIVPLSGPKEWLDSHRASPEAPRQDTQQMASMPVERCYDVRAKMIIAFNEAKKAGGDLDDWLDATYKAALRYSPAPLSPDHSGGGAGVVLPDTDSFIEDVLGLSTKRIASGDYQSFGASCAAKAIDKVKELNQ